MKRIVLSLLLCSLPMVAVAQEIQEAEKKAELAQKLNVPTKSVLGLGAVASVISGLFYGSKYKQAKVDSEKVETELYPWLKGLFERTMPGHQSSGAPFSYRLVPKGNHYFVKTGEAEGCFPKLLKLGFFDRDMMLNGDSNFPPTMEEYWKYQNISDIAKKQGEINDAQNSAFVHQMISKYKVLIPSQPLKYYRFLEKYANDNDLNKADSQAIYNDIVRPQVIKISTSAAAFAACAAGIVAFHTYYKKAVKKVEELKKLK